MKIPATKQSRAEKMVLMDDVITNQTGRKRAAQPRPAPTTSIKSSTASKSRARATLDDSMQPSSRRAARAAPSTFLTFSGGSKLRDFRAIYLSSPVDRINLIRAGVGAIETKAFAVDLGIPQDRFFRMLGIAQATVTRKASKQQAMSTDESEKIVGMAKLLGQVQTILEQSGDRELMKDFDAAKWLATWIEEPVPALGGRCPAEYMDTMEGQEMVSRLLLMMQTGAYA